VVEYVPVPIFRNRFLVVLDTFLFVHLVQFNDVKLRQQVDFIRYVDSAVVAGVFTYRVNMSFHKVNILIRSHI
jgi:hypothetical protein